MDFCMKIIALFTNVNELIEKSKRLTILSAIYEQW